MANDAKTVYAEYQKGLDFKNQIKLFDTVKNNERFFIGDQWNGVQSNGLPTPIFNFLKQVTMFNVASIISNNVKVQATPIIPNPAVNEAAERINTEFERVFEFNKIPALLREYMRNAAVDGDSCLYTYFDADVETGQDAKGAIVTEVIDNTRVYFGNPNDRRVEKQPYIIIETREYVEDVKERAKESGSKDHDLIKSDEDNSGTDRGKLTDGKVTVLLKLWRDKKTKEIYGYECTQDAEVRPEWKLGVKVYPITWLCWDYIKDSYHGQALITGLIPNQVFVNKTFAMVQLSLMSSAFPRTVYDATRIKKFDNRVGTAIGVNGGDVTAAVKTIDGAQVSPQISQFIDSSISYTKSFLGATPAALGETRPDNTSAIIALQRAASVPSEITKQSLHQSVEDLSRIYLEFMAGFYGKRIVGQETLMEGEPPMPVMFDFSQLSAIPLALKLDVGASANWSEDASMASLDNLLQLGAIDLADYLERIPGEYIPRREELIQSHRAKMQQAQEAQMMAQQATSSPDGVMAGQETPIPTGQGNSELQRELFNQLVNQVN